MGRSIFCLSSPFHPVFRSVPNELIHVRLQHRRVSTIRSIRLDIATRDTQLAWPRRVHAEYTVRRQSRLGGFTHNTAWETPLRSPDCPAPNRHARDGAVSTRYSLAPSH